MEQQLIRLYLPVCWAYDKHPELKYQRLSNFRPRFTDEELLTIYLFGHMQGFSQQRLIYDYTLRHWRAWFPLLPSYQAFNRGRVSRGCARPLFVDMNEHRRRLAAVGDDVLLACVRLILFNHRSQFPYRIHAALVGKMVSNDKLAEIAIREGLTTIEGEKLSDSFECEVAEHFFQYGFRSTRIWLEQIYQRHFNAPDRNMGDTFDG